MNRRPQAEAIVTVGLDIAQNVFQVHGIDTQGQVIVRRQLRRNQVLDFFALLNSCLIGIEACAGAHFGRVRWHVWAMMYV